MCSKLIEFEEIKFNFIKSSNSRHSNYIQQFNRERKERVGFLLKEREWDIFASWMNEEHPEIVLQLDYLPEGELA